MKPTALRIAEAGKASLRSLDTEYGKSVARYHPGKTSLPALAKQVERAGGIVIRYGYDVVENCQYVVFHVVGE